MLSKLAILSLFLAGASAVRPRSHQLEGYTFEKYVTDFGMKYSADELETRRALFNTELARVKAHNAKNLSWKEGVNKFSAMTAAEKKGYMGRSKRVKSDLKNSKPLPDNFVIKPLKDLPETVDWRTVGAVSVVKDQGHCGSCWAFASTATIESHVALSTGNMYDLSVQQMAMCAPNPDHCGGIGQCEGSTAEFAFEYVTGSKGMYQEYQYPYESYYGTDYDCKATPGATKPVATIDGYVKLPDNNYTTLMNAVANIGPIAINVDASTWHAYESGVFNGCNQENPDVNHVVVTIGYGEENGSKYWLVRNSWSATFGEQGFIKLLRTDDDESNCGSDVTPQDGVACQDQVDPIKVCGTCGAIYDSSYPLNAQLV